MGPSRDVLCEWIRFITHNNLVNPRKLMENVKKISVSQGEMRPGSSCLQCTVPASQALMLDSAFGPHTVVTLTKSSRLVLMIFSTLHLFVPTIFLSRHCHYTSYLTCYIIPWWGNRREWDNWGDLGVDGWITLGWISRRWEVGMWTGLGWPKTGTGGGRLWVR